MSVWAPRGIPAAERERLPLSDSDRQAPSTRHETDPPVRKGWVRAITSHKRMRMNHDVLSDTPHSSAHALREAPESMSDT